MIDGVTITVFQRVQRLSQLGHSVLLLCPDYRSLAGVYPDWQTYVGQVFPGIHVMPLSSEPFMGLEFEQNVKKSAYPEVLQALETFRPDLIHVDEPERLQLGFGRIPAVDFARRHQIPCVSFLHTNFIDYLEDYFTLPRWMIALMQRVSQRIVCRIYNAYDATFVSSSITNEKFRRMGIQNLIQAELLGIHLHQFQSCFRTANFFEQQYGLPLLETKLATKEPDPKIKLVFLSRLTPDKGWGFLVDAFTQMAQTPQYQPLLGKVALVIAGDGSMRSEIAAQLAALSPLLSSVHFLGRVAPDAVPALLTNSDIHITASEKETKGLTILEAFAAGIPVIAPNAGGVVEMIQPGKNGLLFQPRHWQDFADSLEHLVNAPDLRQSMGAMARQTAAVYDWQAAIDRLVHLWQGQIDRKAARGRVIHSG